MKFHLMWTGRQVQAKIYRKLDNYVEYYRFHNTIQHLNLVLFLPQLKIH